MTAFPLSIAEVNALSAKDFVAAFGSVAEHSAWVAEAAEKKRPFASRHAMAEAFIDAVLDAGEPEKLVLLRAHPDLAGKAALADELAAESKREQAGAGLDRLSAEELAEFTKLNGRYQTDFGFPFILAVKGATKDDVFAAFRKRLRNDAETELHNAVRQVLRIIAFRIEDRVRPDEGEGQTT